MNPKWRIGGGGGECDGEGIGFEMDSMKTNDRSGEPAASASGFCSGVREWPELVFSDLI